MLRNIKGDPKDECNSKFRETLKCVYISFSNCTRILFECMHVLAQYIYTPEACIGGEKLDFICSYLKYYPVLIKLATYNTN